MKEKWTYNHFEFMRDQLVDSTIMTTRVFWRTTYFGATPAEANDMRDWATVLAERNKIPYMWDGVPAA